MKLTEGQYLDRVWQLRNLLLSNILFMKMLSIINIRNEIIIDVTSRDDRNFIICFIDDRFRTCLFFQILR